MSAVSLCLMAQAGRKKSRLVLDLCLDCVFRFSSLERSEFSGTYLAIYKTDTLVSFCPLFQGCLLYWPDSEGQRDDMLVGHSGALPVKSRADLGSLQYLGF